MRCLVQAASQTAFAPLSGLREVVHEMTTDRTRCRFTPTVACRSHAARLLLVCCRSCNRGNKSCNQNSQGLVYNVGSCYKRCTLYDRHARIFMVGYMVAIGSEGGDPSSSHDSQGDLVFLWGGPHLLGKGSPTRDGAFLWSSCACSKSACLLLGTLATGDTVISLVGRV